MTIQDSNDLQLCFESIFQNQVMSPDARPVINPDGIQMQGIHSASRSWRVTQRSGRTAQRASGTTWCRRQSCTSLRFRRLDRGPPKTPSADDLAEIQGFYVAFHYENRVIGVGAAEL